jgi:hypothetical protein
MLPSPTRVRPLTLCWASPYVFRVRQARSPSRMRPLRPPLRLPRWHARAGCRPSGSRCVGRDGPKLSQSSSPRVLGVGVAAALATDHARRGDDRAFVATSEDAHTSLVSLRFDSGDRAAQEAWVTGATLAAAAVASGFTSDVSATFASLSATLSLPSVTLSVTTSDRSRALETFLAGHRPRASTPVVFPSSPVSPGRALEVVLGRPRALVFRVSPLLGRREPLPLAYRVPAGAVVVPGSFNPLHHGHVALARAAA